MKWLGEAEMPSDGAYAFSSAPTLNDETTFYFRGDAPAGQFTFGILDEVGTFIPFDSGLSDVNARFKNGPGVVLAVSVVGALGTTEVGCKP